jgi:hypothetical protein
MELIRYRMSNTTFYRGNSNNNKRNKEGTFFAIAVTSAAIILTLKLYFLWHWPG